MKLLFSSLLNNMEHYYPRKRPKWTNKVVQITVFQSVNRRRRMRLALPRQLYSTLAVHRAPSKLCIPPLACLHIYFDLDKPWIGRRLLSSVTQTGGFDKTRILVGGKGIMTDSEAFASDAPGWRQKASETVPGAKLEDTEELGPICYRCKGSKETLKKVLVEAKSADDNSEDATAGDDKNKDQTEDVKESNGDEQKKKKKKMKKELIKVTCPICNGLGRIKKKRKEVLHATKAGKASSRKRKIPEGWVVPGPQAKGGVEAEMGEEICALLGHWRIFQRIGGHRWSTDDLVTAWVAGRAWKDAKPGRTDEPAYCLDLGCGIGSVLMMVAWQFNQAKCLGVEAQVRSATMARRSLEYNGCTDRCKVVQGDIREYADFAEAAPDGKFDLVTGTPPYFPVNYSADTGVATPGLGGLPSCEQSAPARYEFRGGVEAYCAAARPRLRSRESRFVVCEGLLGENHSRVINGARENGLEVLKKVAVHGRDDKPVLFAVYVMRLAEPDADPADAAKSMVEETLIIRHKGGKRSDAYVSLMADLGIPP